MCYFFLFLSMNLPDDDDQWLKHGAVAIRSDAFGDNQWSKKRLCYVELVVCTHQTFRESNDE